MKSTSDITLADLMRHVEDDGECLIWTGHANEGKYPQWRIGGKLHLVRRVVYELVHGPIAPKLQIGVRCDCVLCVRPDHLVARTRSQANTGRRHTMADKIKIARTKRERSGLLTDEQVREIRMSDERNDAIEARFGLSPGYASRIRTGRVRADYSSPWAALGGRSA